MVKAKRRTKAVQALAAPSYRIEDLCKDLKPMKEIDWGAPVGNEFGAMTDGEITAAAKSDPDNPPITAAEFKRMRRPGPRSAFDKIAAGLNEALEIARGRAKPAKLYEPTVMFKAVRNQLKLWGVTDNQAAILLGPSGRDRHERLSHLLGIHKALRIIFREASRGYAWIKAPNDAFAGRSALDVMLDGKLIGIMRVRRYLEAEARHHRVRLEYGVYT